MLHLLLRLYYNGFFALWAPLNQVIYVVNHCWSPQSLLVLRSALDCWALRINPRAKSLAKAADKWSVSVWHLGCSLWLRPLNIPHLLQRIPSAWLVMLDLKLWLSHFDTITKTICLFDGGTLSCTIYFWSNSQPFLWDPYFMFPLSSSNDGTDHADDLMLHQCIEYGSNVAFCQPRCMIRYRWIIGDIISYWIQLKVLKQQQPVQLSGTRC